MLRIEWCKYEHITRVATSFTTGRQEVKEEMEGTGLNLIQNKMEKKKRQVKCPVSVKLHITKSDTFVAKTRVTLTLTREKEYSISV